jgi:uncharacterized glyoxalase superfamily protein PhnB
MATTTLQARGLMASLTANDIKKSLDYYTALGFEITDQFDEGGVLLGAMLKAGSVEIGLSQDDGKKGADRVKGAGMRLYIETTDDIDALAARVKAAGVALTHDAYDSEWGTRAFDTTDPSGFLITISSPEPETTQRT